MNLIFWGRADLSLLMLTGLFYTLGSGRQVYLLVPPLTGSIVIGPLRASLVYDLPVFSGLPCDHSRMAVFPGPMETDFVEYYDRFYDAVREGLALLHPGDER